MSGIRVRAKVIGAGGIGQRLLDPLCQVLNYGSRAYSFGDVTVSLIDGDTFEERNKPRQQFAERGNKAEIWVKGNQDRFPNLIFRTNPVYIDESNIGMLIQEGDVVFLCVDNHKTRRLVSRYCEEELDNVTVINGGNGSYEGNVMVYIKRNGVNKTLPLHTAKHPSGKPYHPEILNPPADDVHPGETQEQHEGCLEQQADDPQLLIANNMAAAMMLNAFHGLLTGVFDSDNPLNLFQYEDVHFDIRSNTIRNPYLR